MNEESLSRILSNPTSGGIVVVVYGQNHAQSLHVLGHVRQLCDAQKGIQLIPIATEESRHLSALPALSAVDAPAVYFFLRGRPFCSPVSDVFQISDRIRRLVVCSTEPDPFGPLGTGIRVIPTTGLNEWKPKCAGSVVPNTGLYSVLTPVYVLMDTLFDV
jgi:hypothetical protein